MKLKAYLAIALVFLLGMISGGALVVQIVKSRLQSLASSSTEEVSQIVFEMLDRDLNLSEEQRNAISGVMAEAVQEIDPIRTQMREKALKIIQKYQARIGDELSADQRQEFDQMVDKFKGRSNLEGGAEHDLPKDP